LDEAAAELVRVVGAVLAAVAHGGVGDAAAGAQAKELGARHRRAAAAGTAAARSAAAAGIAARSRRAAVRRAVAVLFVLRLGAVGLAVAHPRLPHAVACRFKK